MPARCCNGISRSFISRSFSGSRAVACLFSKFTTHKNKEKNFTERI
jgi:hypothetical protein